ncbi:peptidoglycan editing factor PgeF [Gordonia desulfuricans]|uniref:Purine nucleoside phosphorylase n=1 Tax=Gordonia desulfuricans TaxID=89051 RepID=A0A7K3LQF4_9ACTN|nr:peptidoglycan editing factor PgeF [Gordonia desulfuricans]NDK90492.1 peptidoglycan editing factor PgeF [Gordonia desulfuricans]
MTRSERTPGGTESTTGADGAEPAARTRRVITTRAGGVSRAPYDSFNLGDHVGDDPAAVGANRSRLASQIGLPDDSVIWMEQIHSRNVTVVDDTTAQTAPRKDGWITLPATDALVTTTPGLALAVLSADCVPVLLSDDEAGVIAGVHAGRVGARIGIVPAVLRVMIGLGARPERIGAFLGPAASGERYEVPDAMQRDVEEHLPGSACRTRQGTAGLDLRAGLRRQLLAAGVGAVAVDPRCTITDGALFSHRRQAPTGRLASVIWIDPETGRAGTDPEGTPQP